MATPVMNPQNSGAPASAGPLAHIPAHELFGNYDAHANALAREIPTFIVFLFVENYERARSWMEKEHRMFLKLTWEYPAHVSGLGVYSRALKDAIAGPLRMEMTRK